MVLFKIPILALPEVPGLATELAVPGLALFMVPGLVTELTVVSEVVFDAELAVLSDSSSLILFGLGVLIERLNPRAE